MSSHPKSIWKGTTKYVVPAPAAGQVKVKPAQVWNEYRIGGKLCGWRGACAQCGRAKFATSKHNLHLLAQLDGRCYACRELKQSENAPKSRPVTVTDATLKGGVPVPRPLTRELASRGSTGHALHKVMDQRRLHAPRSGSRRAGPASIRNRSNLDPSRQKQQAYVHLGRHVTDWHDARYLSAETATAIRKKMPNRFPFWSCCLQPVGALLACPKAKANEAHVKWLSEKAEEASKLSRQSRPNSRQIKLDRTRALLNSVRVDDSSDDDNDD